MQEGVCYVSDSICADWIYADCAVSKRMINAGVPRRYRIERWRDLPHYLEELWDLVVSERSIEIAEKRVVTEVAQGINAMDTDGMASQTGEAFNTRITGDPRIAKEPQDNALYGLSIVQGVGTEKPETGILPQIGTGGAVADNSETNKSEKQQVDLAEKRIDGVVSGPIDTHNALSLHIRVISSVQ
jgi:hypothetical protein